MARHLELNGYHHAPITCPHCGQFGRMVWEAELRPDRTEKVLVRIDGAFHEQLSPKAPYPLELICKLCGATQNSPLQDGQSKMTDKHIPFSCPHCGQGGDVSWHGEGIARVLVSLSDGFHVEDGRLPGARHVIICDACDEIDPPRLALPNEDASHMLD